jgi:hypothetical protein
MMHCIKVLPRHGGRYLFLIKRGRRIRLTVTILLGYDNGSPLGATQKGPKCLKLQILP